MPVGIYKRTAYHNKINSVSHRGIGKGKPFSGIPSDWHGKKHSIETKKKMSLARVGIKLSEETRRKISKARSGENCIFWKGGITEANKAIRNGIEFRLWREAVFARDNWVCQKYGARGGDLVPHHILNFSEWPELRFAIDNGITLSDKAHQEFHKIYGNKNNTREQLKEFLTYGQTKID